MTTPKPITPSQVPLIHDLIARCYREYGLTFNLADECEKHIRDPIPYFRSAGGDFWAVTDSGAVIATAALDLHDGAELKSMYVDPAHRRKGLGSLMTRHIIDQARARGHESLTLWSDTRFTPAHAMYERLGFTRTGLRDIHDSNNSREFGFHLLLAPP